LTLAPMTLYMLIAEKFGKSHGKVLPDIANISCSEEFMQANFGLNNFTDARGNTQPFFYITEQGFSWLMTEYTGKKAKEFKEKFLAAFKEGREAIAILDNDDAILARAFNILRTNRSTLRHR
jgi:Rha family phage regulatory protein